MKRETAADRFSAALCRGLIEARITSAPSAPCSRRFPRLYVAASLKPARGRSRERAAREFSAALCRGLIEAAQAADNGPIDTVGFPRLYVAASLKRRLHAVRDARAGRFPRLYVAASLKRGTSRRIRWRRAPFSAALCRGLIEATSCVGGWQGIHATFSAALCRGLIEAICARPRSGRLG